MLTILTGESVNRLDSWIEELGIGDEGCWGPPGCRPGAPPEG